MPSFPLRSAVTRLLVSAAWILAAFLIAAIVGPWLSDHVGVALPAFAMVRTRRTD